MNEGVLKWIGACLRIETGCLATRSLYCSHESTLFIHSFPLPSFLLLTPSLALSISPPKLSFQPPLSSPSQQRSFIRKFDINRKVKREIYKSKIINVERRGFMTQWGKKSAIVPFQNPFWEWISGTRCERGTW